ncbi:DUF221-domain-containing protein [Aulographum hederae CBS 113979]|uniref:DUF221-domain-containing protein n=1 Tax=Aulographum hederae CBS 113979 TaxID=1176131 RepID=A0A6G1GUP9_9PEZI|nr:DUF221-domain-containing protein [Aulographum hederae CBS 113979]
MAFEHVKRGAMEAVKLVARQQQGENRNQGSNSLSGLVSTLVPVLLLALVYVFAFTFLRRKFPRVYAPRSYLEPLPETQRTPKMTDKLMGYVIDMKTHRDHYILNHSSLDGYLFVRFFKLMVIICFAGCCITWPVLFPVNATAGGGQEQLDILSWSNVLPGPRYYAHCFIGMIFYSFVMFAITRETLYFINLRQAYLLSAWSASRMSSRTVIYTGVPKKYLTEATLRTIFPRVKQAWFVTNTDDLEEKVEERDKAAMKLETAEIKLSKEANARRLKALKKSQKSKNADGDAEAAIHGDGMQWLDAKKRPTHRLKLLIGKKVDTIDWARTELEKLIPEVEVEQDKHISGKVDLVPAVIIEFEDQAAAQYAYCVTPHNIPQTFAPRAIGVNPASIIWKNLSLSYTSRTIRWIGATAFITAMVIFWAIPVAVVGIISNVNYLTTEVTFLAWINDIPTVILGVVTGLLPVVLLAVLMALVPIICRFAAKISGCVSLAEIELQTQSWYFAFQVIQVFLITTFTSAASSVAAQIFQNPGSAVSLLATNLPKASNFYINYFILYGVAQSAKFLFNIGAFVGFVILAKFLDTTPRKMYNRYMKMAQLGWGSTYPVFTNLGVIAITYSVIAPLVLGFATVGLGLLYLAYRYNFLYVYGDEIDTHGASYARALQQLTTGVYLSQLCLIGLFAIGVADAPEATGALILMIIFLIFTVIFHLMMRSALKPLTQFLPRNLLIESEVPHAAGREAGEHNNMSSHQLHPGYDTPAAKPREDSDGTVYTDEKATAAANNGTNGAEMQHAASNVNDISALHDGAAPNRTLTARFKAWFQPHNSDAVSMSKLLHPSLHQALPAYSAEVAKQAYMHPLIAAEKPQLWIVRDDMGISQREVTESSKVVAITDEGAHFNEKNKVVWDTPATEAPLWEKILPY